MNQVTLKNLSCSLHIRNAIRRYRTLLVEEARENLVALYLFGSLARGCYNERTSDVDLLAVSSKPYSTEVASRIAGLHSQSRLTGDVIFVTVEQMKADCLPTPVDFVVKPDGRLFRNESGSMDFFINRQDVYECGIALLGPPAKEIVPAVLWPLLSESLLSLLPHIADRFKNPILMFCRIVYAVHHRSLCSKVVAGQWAKEHLDKEWREVIDAALAEYTAGAAQIDHKQDAVISFGRYCEQFIAGAADTSTAGG
jgi:predicted nucleotidyltransferase